MNIFNILYKIKFFNFVFLDFTGIIISKKRGEMIKKNLILFLRLFLIILFVFLPYCSNSDVESDEDPVLVSITPSSKAVNMPQFTLTARGQRFTEYSKIYFNEISRTTIFISESELSCVISSESLTSEAEISVKISNGGGNFSDVLRFEIKDNNSFILPVLTTEENSTSFNPSITSDISGDLFIAYERYDDDDSMNHVSVISSFDKGEDWGGPVDVFSSVEKIYNPDITSGPDGFLYITFYKSNLYFSFSEDSGETWSDPQIISFSTPSPIESRISVDDEGNINIIWLLPLYSQNTSVYYTRSEDGGLNFSTEVNISSEKDNFSSAYNPCLAVNGSDVYVGWTAWPLGGSRYSYVYFNFSVDNGNTWNSKDKYFGVCSGSDLCANGEANVYFALSSSYLPFQNRIALYRSTNSALNWEAGVGVTSESHDTYPLIRSDSEGNLNILLKRGSAYFYSRSCDGGDTWTEPLYVTDKISQAYQKKLIDMAIDKEGTLYIVSEYDNAGILYFSKSL